MVKSMTEDELRDFYIELGLKIRNLRRLSNQNQLELGILLGLSRTSIVNIEKGKQRPSPHLLFLVCQIYSVDINSLFPKQFTELVRKSSLVNNEMDKFALEKLKGKLN